MMLEHSSNSRHLRKPGLLDLPRECIRLIATHIYDPLELTQQDRLTWGIFSTVDMHPTRQDDLTSITRFGWTCRKVRREVRVVLFRCIRVNSVGDAEHVMREKWGWARYVKSVIIDLSMFDPDDTLPDPPPRSCWIESALLTHLLNTLPSLQHLSFFADASDDITLSLLFSSLIPHPSTHNPPPPTIPPSLAPSPSSSPLLPPTPLPTLQPHYIPLHHRLRSFGWRQRHPPPPTHSSFTSTSTFISTHHLLRHAHRLSHLVLDADLSSASSTEILLALKELSLRSAPVGERAERVSVMLCGPVDGWRKGFWEEVGKLGGGEWVKEVFVDRPLRKSLVDWEITREEFIDLVSPLATLTHLTLLQIGSYTISTVTQLDIARDMAAMIPSLLVLGLLDEDGETVWWGIWREGVDVEVKSLADGDLKRLEDGRRLARRSAQSKDTTTISVDEEGDAGSGLQSRGH